MAFVYEEFLKEAQQIIKEISLTYGTDVAYRNVSLAGGIQKHKNRPISRVVILPVDTENVKTSDILLEISLSPKAWRYRIPSLWEGKIDGDSWHPMGVPEEQRSELKKSLLKNLETFEQKLAALQK